MPLVVGLGNPGVRYATTRHNVGWRVVEILAARWRAVPGPSAPEYRSWIGTVSGRSATLMQPLTFMNVSGEAVRAYRAQHPLEPAELLVVADDVYLPVGVLRARGTGSNGGHRGLESIELLLETIDYARLRVGVGSVEAERLREHVLEEPDSAERDELDRATERAADAVECWVSDGLLATMNRFNRKVGKEVSES